MSSCLLQIILFFYVGIGTINRNYQVNDFFFDRFSKRVFVFFFEIMNHKK